MAGAAPALAAVAGPAAVVGREDVAGPAGPAAAIGRAAEAAVAAD